MTVELLNDLSEAVIDGNEGNARQLVDQALRAGIVAEDVLNKGLIPAMNIVGQRFRDGETFIPEMLCSAKTMQAAVGVLKPLLTDGVAAASGTVVIGTVQDDIHSIGKDLVALMLEGAGFRVIDLGVDVTPEAFVDAVRTYEADIVALSALLTSTMPNMSATVEALKEAGVREKVKVMAGGAPITPAFVQKIGADGYAPNAGAAVDEARTLIAK
jgi:5-methyltetrahydrofolate--homocysteine methyltransferase